MKENRKKGRSRGRDNRKKTKMRGGGAEGDIEAMREGFDTNKSVQRSRKVEMRRGRDNLDEKKSSFEYRGRESVRGSVYCRGGRVISSC